MKNNTFTICLIMLVFNITSCSIEKKEDLKFLIYSNGTFISEISPKDILFYDTSLVRSHIGIHEIRLDNNYFSEDSMMLVYPIEIKCQINNKHYFTADYFRKRQSSPTLAVNFHFDTTCTNRWAFNEFYANRPFRGDTIIVYPSKVCNSIELFHLRESIRNDKESYIKHLSLNEFTDTAKLAHELLYDSSYLNAIKKSGITIK